MVEARRGQQSLPRADAELPAFAAATGADTAIALAAALGLPGATGASLISYRPGLRAVVRVRHPEGDAFLKVLRPPDAERLVRLRALLAEHGLPLPRVIGATGDGAVLIAGAAGIPGPDALLEAGPDAIVAAVDALRERIRAVPMRHAARDSLASRADWYCDRLAELLPDAAERIQPIRAYVLPTMHSPAGRAPVHGDLHLGQIFFGLDPVRITGLIDVDTVGLGTPDDDAAAFIAHAATSAELNRALGRARDAAALDGVVRAAADAWLGTAHARAVTIVHLVGHAVRAAETSRDVAARALVQRAEALLPGAPVSPARSA